MFQKAIKSQARLRCALMGGPGAGKTYSALLLAKHIGGRVALIDTEHGSASKYADEFDFDTVCLEEFSLETYIKTIKSAGGGGYGVLVIDSLSHAWSGKGGALEEVDRLGGSNKFANGWRQVTPKQNELVESILAYPGHVITTLRTKVEYVIEDVNGKKVPRKVGMAPIQRDQLEYEFDVVADLNKDGAVTITKSRCKALNGSAGLMCYSDVPKMAQTLKAWLSDGAEVASSPGTPQQAPAVWPEVQALLARYTTPQGKPLSAGGVVKSATGKTKPAQLVGEDIERVRAELYALESRGEAVLLNGGSPA